MKLHLDNTGEYKITSYGPGVIKVSDVPYAGAVVIKPDEAPAPWDVRGVEDFDAARLTPLLASRPEVLLLGTGRRQMFPPIEQLAFLYASELGFEIMDTAAACRTFNILAAEGRRVIAAVLPLD